MKITESSDSCSFYIEFDSKKEEKYYKDLVREWSGRKRVTKKLFSEWANYVVREFVIDEMKKKGRR